MKIEKTTYLNCFCDFAHGAKIRTNSVRSLEATCDPGEAERIIKTYFKTEFFPRTGARVLWRGNWTRRSIRIHFLPHVVLTNDTGEVIYKA